MSLNKLKSDIEKVDDLICSLGGVGEGFVRDIQSLGVDLVIPTDADGDYFLAKYNSISNVFYIPSNLPLAELFNVRVHEASHAIQFRKATNIATKLAEGCDYSLEDEIRKTRLAEMNAHGVQAYFNNLAMKKTGDRGFLECFGKHKTFVSYSRLQRRLMKKNISPEGGFSAVVDKFPSLFVRIFDGNPFIGIRQRHAYDLHKIMAQSEYEDVASGDQMKLISLAKEEMAGIVNAVISLPKDQSERIVSQISAPLKLHPINRFAMKRLGVTF